MDYPQTYTLLPAWHMQLIVLFGYITKVVNFRCTNLKKSTHANKALAEHNP